MNKHAYLIMAHNNFGILEKTLKILDDERNDFYIHIDKKVKNFNFEKFKNIVKKSKVIFTDRVNVKWGHSSQINCELILLKTALKNEYSYYHLLSGVDMPIKSKEEIYHFFPYYLRSKYKYILWIIEIILVTLQKLLKINRIKNQNI